MKMMKTTKKFMMLALCCLMVLLALKPSVVKADRDAGTDIDRSGILQINVYHYDSNNDQKYFIQSGSGFLITDSEAGTQYVITCDHVAEVSKDVQKLAKETFNVKKLNIKIEVVVTRDITQTATLVNASVTDDFAILKLDAPIHQKKAMIIRPEGAELTEDVYAMGYPAAISELTDFNYYSEDQVTVSKGSVSLCEMSNNGVPYIQHSASMTQGCSGGPLVDKNGYVVGLNTFTYYLGDATYYYSLKISEVTNALDMLGISYQTPDGSTGNTSEESTTEAASEASETATEADTTDATEETPTSEALPTVDTSALDEALTEATGYLEDDYTADSFAELQTAITDAKAVKNNAEATQSDIDRATGNLKTAIDGLEKASNTTLLIIIIIAVVVVIVVVIIIIVAVRSSKKKSAPVRTNSSNVYPSTPAGIPSGMSSQSAATVPPVAPPVPPMQPQASVMPQTPVPPVQPVMPVNQTASGYVGEGAGETSVLGYGTGETTVLGGTNQMKASLTRVKTNEKVDIVKQLFRIGKERNKVDYCITNNNSVSRIHADIVFKNGQYYIIDNNSTNYTFVNGQMIPAKQEIALSDGDRIKLSEEEFIFKLG